MSTAIISAKIPTVLREQIDEIARLEQRSASNVVRLAIEHYVRQYTELHPQFKADILEGLTEMSAGNSEPYEFGQERFSLVLSPADCPEVQLRQEETAYYPSCQD